MYVIISGLSGGTNPSFLAGCWKITSIDSGSSQITIASTHWYGSAPSGAVAGTVTGLGATLQFNGCSGFQVYAGSAINFGGGFAVIGNNTTGAIGLDVEDASRLFMSGPVGVSGFPTYNVLANYSSHIVGSSILAVSGYTGATSYYGIYIDTNAVLDTQIIASGM